MVPDAFFSRKEPRRAVATVRYAPLILYTVMFWVRRYICLMPTGTPIAERLLPTVLSRWPRRRIRLHPNAIPGIAVCAWAVLAARADHGQCPFSSLFLAGSFFMLGITV